MKKLISFVFVALLCISLAACTGRKPTADSTAQPTAEAINTAGATEAAAETEPAATVEPDVHYLTYEEVYNPDTDYDNDLGHTSLTILDTDDAFYYAGSGHFLYYYDKAVGDYAVLCAKPECMHDYTEYNEECNGQIRAFDGATINMYQGKIYYDYTKDPQRTLYRMDPDGSGKEKLFDIDCDFQYQPQRLAIHRGKLYGLNYTSVVVNAEPKETWNLTCWDLETGEWKVIYEEYTSAWPSMYFFGDSVYFCASYAEEEVTEDFDVVWGDTNVKIFRYDAQTEQVEKLLDVTGPDYAVDTICVAAENKIYATVKRATGSVSIYEVSDGDLKELFTAEAFGDIWLYPDKIVLAGFKPIVQDIYARSFRFVTMDYEGSVLFDEIVDLDLVRSIGEGITGLYFLEIFAVEDGFIVAYDLDYDNAGDEESHHKTCLVKYEFTGGSAEQTLLAVAKWR